MPWRESKVMEERMRFARDYERAEMTMAELCRVYGIARKTGYKIWRRWEEQGVAGLKEWSRAPLRHPNQTPAAVEAALLALRREHMRWGPRKLREVLRRSQNAVPAASTIGALLQRAGLVVERRRRRRTPPYTQPFAAADGPNRVWCADFKGHPPRSFSYCPGLAQLDLRLLLTGGPFKPSFGLSGDFSRLHSSGPPATTERPKN